MVAEDLRRYLVLPRGPNPLFPFPDIPFLQFPSSTPPYQSSGNKRTASNMTFDTAADAPHLGAGSAIGDAKFFTLDDYMAANEEAVSDMNSAFPIKRIKTDNPSNSLNPNNTASNSNGPVPLPVAVGARSSKHIVLLHEKYQALALDRPEFIFTGSSENGWCVRTTFLGEDLETVGPYSSKHEGKEALSERVLAVIEQAEKDGRLSKSIAAKKELKEMQKLENREKESGTNWTGQLLEFQRANSAPQPLYTDYALGTSFTCLLTIDGHPTPFGSQTALFSSKKAARQHAASCAVEHFKAQGVWPSDIDPMGGIKKKKLVIAPPAPKPRKSAPSTDTYTSCTSPDNFYPAATGSFAQQAADLALSLSFCTPEWRFAPENPAAPGFRDVACYIKNGGAHEGPIGQVRHVFGKKKAKDECARQTVAYLVRVRDERLRQGRKMMQGEGETSDEEDAVAQKTMPGDGYEDSDAEFHEAAEAF